MHIHISPDTQHRLQKFVDSGLFSSIEDAAETALKDRLVMEEWLMANREAVDRAIDEGIESIEKGDFVTLEALKKEFL